MLQVHLSGGEPTLRRDLEQLIAPLAARGVYTNLITAGVGIADGRMARPGRSRARPCAAQLPGRAAGDHGDASATIAAAMRRSWRSARRCARAGLPLTLNAPIHRHNIDQVPEFIDLALELGAERLEIANVQYSGWASPTARR